MSFSKDRRYPWPPPPNKATETWPSVTTVTGQLDKSGPLISWAVNCCSNYTSPNILFPPL